MSARSTKRPRGKQSLEGVQAPADAGDSNSPRPASPKRKTKPKAKGKAKKAMDPVRQGPPRRWTDVEKALPRSLTAEAVAQALAELDGADVAERKEAVRALTLRTHPDKGGDANAFRLLAERKSAFLSGP